MDSAQNKQWMWMTNICKNAKKGPRAELKIRGADKQFWQEKETCNTQETLWVFTKIYRCHGSKLTIVSWDSSPCFIVFLDNLGHRTAAEGAVRAKEAMLVPGSQQCSWLMTHDAGNPWQPGIEAPWPPTAPQKRQPHFLGLPELWKSMSFKSARDGASGKVWWNFISRHVAAVRRNTWQVSGAICIFLSGSWLLSHAMCSWHLILQCPSKVSSNKTT